jgi:hypothetical protein
LQLEELSLAIANPMNAFAPTPVPQVTPGAPVATPTPPRLPSSDTPPARPIQPALSGLEVAETRISDLQDVQPVPVVARAPRQVVHEGRRSRRRYWSVRDLSRRLWLGRGYDLLRGLIRAGVLPATRSTRSWWIDDEDAAGLIAAFEDRAGKVRAFTGLDAWLRSRCYVAPLTPDVEAFARLTRSGFAWRGRVYLPKTVWEQESGAEGVAFRHPSGFVAAGDEPAAEAA